MKAKRFCRAVLRLSGLAIALQAALAVDARAAEAPEAAPQRRFALALRGGAFGLAHRAQAPAGNLTSFDARATELRSIDLEYRMRGEFGFGLEKIGYRNRFLPQAGTAGEMEFAGIFANVRRYYPAAPAVQLFVGGGLGLVGVRFSSSILSGSTSGLGQQVMGGAELRAGRMTLLLEARKMYARTTDSAGNRADASGLGIFAGVGLRF